MKPEDRELTLPNGISFDFVLCRIGRFNMGSGDDEAGRDSDERRHAVAMGHDFWIGKFPVTQSQWECVMGINPSRIKGGDLPIVNVSFGDCLAFATVVGEMVGENVRLPKEAEWEYACRAGTETAYCWGDSSNGGNMPSCLSLVTSCWRNPWGISGMHGNVFEWCDGWYDADYGMESSGLCFDAKRYRVVRGGSWKDWPERATSSFRVGVVPYFHAADVGFRPVIAPKAN